MQNRGGSVLRAIGSLVLLVAILAVCMGAISRTKVTKQYGGSTGDSCVAAADTSTRVVLREDVIGFWVTGQCDSATVFKLQVSSDSTNWATVDSISVSNGWIESGTDFGKKYQGWYARVIQDVGTASTTAWGAAWVVVDRP